VAALLERTGETEDVSVGLALVLDGVRRDLGDAELARV